MNDEQWAALCAAVEGAGEGPATGFIVDSPWLPGWRGMTVLDYLAGDELWFEANLAAVRAFPSTALIPGFWAEYGMCTEPSAFGATCSFPANEFPHAKPAIRDPAGIDWIEEPDPAKDGLLPFVLRRMEWARPRMEAVGHKIRFSCSRGPLNIASFLMGMTEFLIALKTEPERVERLLDVVTSFLAKWHALQRERFPTIDGILVLDDIVGFIDEEDFKRFALPRLAELFSPPARIKLFHNDAPCAASVRHYAGIGINLYNPGIHSSLTEIVRLTGGRLPILGAIPPRDVMAAGSPAEVAAAARRQLEELPAGARVVHSVAGGMPPGVPTENIAAFLRAFAG